MRTKARPITLHPLQPGQSRFLCGESEHNFGTVCGPMPNINLAQQTIKSEEYTV